MKKNVLCIFFLVLYLLVVCTILSLKIEDTMMTKVVTMTAQPTGVEPTELKKPTLFSDMMGDHLYEVTEGIGWNTGLRAAEYPAGYYDKEAMTVQVYSEFTYIVTASRQPREGEQIDIIAQVKDLKKEADDYLIVYPNGKPDFEAMLEDGVWDSNMAAQYERFLEKAEIKAQSGSAMLLRIEEGTLPYTEHTAKMNVAILEGLDWQIYRTADVEQMLKMLPLLAVLIIVVVLSIVIWAHTCVLARDEDENGRLIKVNAGIVAALVGVLCILLAVIELPASLMPLDIIFDTAHYSQVFGSIFGELAGLGSVGQSILTLANQMKTAFWIVLAVGAVICALPVVIEVIIMRRRGH